MADFKHLVRIANTDLKGEKAIVYALKDVRGLGVPFAHAICTVLNIDGLAKIGNIPDADMKRIDEVIKAPAKHGIPAWMFNRRHDLDTGEDKHVVTNDLIFNKDNDIKLMKRIKCYKGVRHSSGLPVRGQRTKAHFRHGKSVGVAKKSKKTGKT